ncbi:sulfotransferase [Salipiger bermudensis]|uniref:sulfotransferase family protein n=1 Tax=Salipiger bermudensis TaxID=344736 RepID=UPI003009C13E
MSTDAKLLPDFIIIGAMKCGTTTLYRYLALHPEIDMSRDKETDFFVAEKNWGKGLGWYSNQFTHADRVRGEASPNYTKCRDFPGVAQRISETCPDVKLIYIVREPVSRAESQFRHSFIMEGLESDLQGFEDSRQYAHILDSSHYARQVEEYLRFFPKEAFLFLDFDELRRDPQGVMNKVTDHVGVSRMQIEDLGKQNDSAELSRVPGFVLRFASSALGRRLAGLMSRDLRNRIRGGLAFQKARVPPGFSEDLKVRMQSDLDDDSARFREISGLSLSGWR